MRFERPRAFLRTFRVRLTLWNTLVFFALLLITMLGIREGLRFTLARLLDALLVQDSKDLERILDRDYPKHEPVTAELRQKAFGDVERGWFAQIFDADGRLWVGTDTVPTDFDLPAPPIESSPPFGVGRYRLYERIYEVPGRGTVLIRVGSSLSFVSDPVDRLTQLILVSSLGVLLVTPVIAYFLAGRMTNPLAKIVQTTATLRADRPEDRLPLRGTGDELDRLSGTINGLLDRLAEDLNRQRDFVANAAHELRSPLTALRSAIDVGLEHERAPTDYRELLADLAEECAGLSGLANQLLLLAEGESGRIKPGEVVVAFDQIVGKAVEMFRGVAEQRGVTISLAKPGSVPVRGEASHLRQIVNNLIDNAIKFTPSNGHVQVEVTVEGTGAVLRVRDSGVGIAAEELPKIFNRFYRADKARRRDYPAAGTGLGLSICQAIISAYHGHIAVDSEPGKGTLVAVILPLAI